MRRADRIGMALIAVAVLFGLGLRYGLTLPPGRAPQPVVETVAPRLPDELTGWARPEEEPVEVIHGQLGDPPKARPRRPHIELVGEPGRRRIAHEFRFEGRTYEVVMRLDRRLYEGALAADRMISSRSGETDDERDSAYYRYMVQDPEQAPLITQLAEELRAFAQAQKMGPDRYAEFIAKYVQSLPYDFPKLKDDDITARFPVETIVDGTGVCGDKSLLLAALLAHEGYEVALLAFEAEKHMAVGVRGDGNHYGSTGYLFIETTAPTYLSEIPERYVSGVQLTTEPLVIPIGTGTRGYGSAEAIARILEVRAAARPAAEELYADSLELHRTQEQADDVNGRLRSAYDAASRLQQVDGREREYLDRAPALQWIERECWWQ